MSLTLTRFLHRKLRRGWKPQWEMETNKASWIWACNCTCILLKPHHLSGCAHPIFSVLPGLDDTAVPSLPSASPPHLPPALQMLNRLFAALAGRLIRAATSKTCLSLKYDEDHLPVRARAKRDLCRWCRIPFDF